jgi:ceramide glucosyltransferase
VPRVPRFGFKISADALLSVAAVWTAATVATYIYASRKAPKRSHRRTTSEPHVTWALPISGQDAADGLSFTAGDAQAHTLPPYNGTMDVILLAAGDDAKAQERARQHASAFTQRGYLARVHMTDTAALNRKAGQLGQLPATPEGGLILSLDSDCIPSTVCLEALIDQLTTQSALGAVWQPTVPRILGETLGDRFSDAVLAGSAHAFPYLAALDGQSAVGKVLLYRASTVAAAEGWQAGQRAIADDVAFGAALLRRGLHVAPYLGGYVQTVRRGQSVTDVFSRLTRWALAIRVQRPHILLTYPLYLCATGGQLVLCYRSWRQGASGLRAALTAWSSFNARLQLSLILRRRMGTRPGVSQACIDFLLADSIMVLAFLRALTQRSVLWHGQRMRPFDLKAKTSQKNLTM